jgi:lipoprotein signal peptidase
MFSLSKFGPDLIVNCDYPFSNLFTVKQFLLMGIFVLSAFLYFLYPRLARHKYGSIAVLFIVTGGFINGVERLSTGCVMDTFDFFSFFHFNIADLMINAGILLSLYIICRKK